MSSHESTATSAELLTAILRAWEALEPEDQAALALHAPDLRRAIHEARPRGSWWAVSEEELGGIARSRA